MNRRSRLALACATSWTAACLLAAAPAARAYVTTDLNDFNLTESTSTYGAPSQYHVSTGTDGWVAYRWLDDPDKATVISTNRCSDYSLLGGPASIAAHNTSYVNLHQGYEFQCFVVRGRTTSGSGSLVNHDGRIRR